MSEYTFPTRTDATSTATAGKDYLIYLNTGTTEAAPTWTLLGGQRSGDLNREADEIVLPIRLPVVGNLPCQVCAAGLSTLKPFTLRVIPVPSSWRLLFWQASRCMLNLNIRIRALLPVGVLLLNAL